MSFTTPDFAPAYPEIFVLAMACVVLLVDLFVSDRNRGLTYALAMLTLAGAAWITAVGAPAEPVLTFAGTYVSDPLANVLKLFTYGVVAVAFLYSRDYLKVRGLFKGEFYVLGLFAMMGVMVMISAHSLLTVYLGLELLSLSLYALVAFDRDSPVAAESAMKYFVLGAIASGTLLYGMSILYGVLGTLDLSLLSAAIGGVMEAGGGPSVGLLFGLAFVIVGIAFKFGAVPFHMWLPDVYHGAPTAVTLYLGTAPKLAAFALAIRVLAEGLGGLTASWQDMIAVMAFLSMALGNIVAIAQTNLKRMLAYSTISHVGFILLGVLAGTPEGYRAAMYYTLAYVVMAAAAFGMIILLSRRGFEADRLDDFKGLNSRSPWYAAIMLIVMFSMAGVPPFVGFYAKLAVIAAALNADYLWLGVAAVVFSVIGAYYYLRVVKLMYFDESQDDSDLEAGIDMRVVLSVNGLAVLGLGIFPNALVQVCAAMF